MRRPWCTWLLLLVLLRVGWGRSMAGLNDTAAEPRLVTRCAPAAFCLNATTLDHRDTAGAPDPCASAPLVGDRTRHTWCTVAEACVRPAPFWEEAVGAWPETELTRAVCGLSYMDVLRAWPAHGPQALCGPLTESWTVLQLNVDVGEAPLPPTVALRADRARYLIDDCCAGLPVNEADLHALTAALYSYSAGELAAVPACPAPPAPARDWYPTFLYDAAGAMRTEGVVFVTLVPVMALLLLLAAVVGSAYERQRVRQRVRRQAAARQFADEVVW